MLCRLCNSPMRYTMRFVDGKSLELEICPKCHFESKPVPIKFARTNANKQMAKKKSDSEKAVNNKPTKRKTEKVVKTKAPFKH